MMGFQDWLFPKNQRPMTPVPPPFSCDLYGRRGPVQGDGPGDRGMTRRRPSISLEDTVGKIHTARLQNSPRLQRVLRVLSDGQEHTTWEIVMTARVCAVNSAVAELRANGIPVTCRQVGDRKFAYQIGQEAVANVQEL